jgi:ubiquitin C-terminal hydrolase
VRATKLYELYKVPEYLLIHLKRFKHTSVSDGKICSFVNYPLKNFNLKEFAVENAGVFELYGVINHYGSLKGGHYTSFVKKADKWYEFDDSSVSPIIENRVVSSSAYVLFYKKT